jgi:hypothetical protein
LLIETARNVHAPARTILTGVGPLEVSRPRVDERKAIASDPEHESFTSGVLPRFLRRTPSVEGVVAVLYLKGISTNDFDTTLRAIYGEQAGSLSAATVSRLKDVFSQESEARHCRRGAGLLESSAAGISKHAYAALLGAQNGECPR